MTSSAFTLAEVLITLGIIGIVAALTLPNLIADYKKKVYVEQLKKNYSVLQQGFAKIMADEEVQNFEDTSIWKSVKSKASIYVSSNPEFYNILKKYFSITKICDQLLCPEIYSRNKYSYLKGGLYGQNSELPPAVFLADGTIMYIQPYGLGFGPTPKQTLNVLIYIDVNGEKPPNKFGRDFYILCLYNNGDIVSRYSKKYFEYAGSSASSYSNYCSINDIGYGCADRIIENGWVMDY